MTQQEFENLKTEILSFLKEKKVCTPAYKGIIVSQNFNSMYAVLKSYWSSMMFEYKSWLTSLIDNYYKVYKNDFNAVGFFYNEGSDKGVVFLSDSTEVEVSGDAEVYAIGNSKYKANEHVRVYAYDESTGSIEGYAKAILNDNASCEAYGFSSVTANGNNTVLADGAVTVYAGGASNVKALRWKRIIGTGNSKILSPIKRNIELSGNSTYSNLI